MIRSFPLLLLAATSALLMACTRTPAAPQSVAPAQQPATPAQNPASQPVTSNTPGETAPNFTFTPAAGQVFSVTLPGHGTTGYSWNLVPGFDAKVAQPKGEVRFGQLPPNAGIGASANEIYDFTAVGSGRTSLTFALYRSWEGPTKAAESRTFNVVVP